jgi:tetratricopeptide (TPR) repeat protein
MSRNYLLGPLSADQSSLGQSALASGHCRIFNSASHQNLTIAPADSWSSILERVPAGWQPDFLVLNLGGAAIPPALWDTPIPIVGLATDWPLCWHYYRRVLSRCDLVLTDLPGVELLTRAGHAQVRSATLSGLPESALDEADPNRPRDIDILFVGDLDVDVHPESLAWVGRLGRLASRWKVVIRAGVVGEASRSLLGRARVVFNRSRYGECNQFAFDAAAAGALLFQEAGNREVPAFFGDRRECVLYHEHDLESLLDHYLSAEAERRTLAEAARRKVREFTAKALWDRALGTIEQEWETLAQRCRQRPRPNPEELLVGRCWQALSTDASADPGLLDDLGRAVNERPSAELSNALGVMLAKFGRGVRMASDCFRKAVAADTTHFVAALNLVEALAELGESALATEGARHVLVDLDRGLDPRFLDAPHFPPQIDAFRVEWERAAFLHAGSTAQEARAKTELIHWRLHALLADLTGDMIHFQEAALARPGVARTRAALGCALGRAGRFAESLPHLRHAVEANPLDADAARALAQSLTEVKDSAGRDALAQLRRDLARAAPGLIRQDAWFAETPPSAAQAIQAEWGSARATRYTLPAVAANLVSGTNGTNHKPAATVARQKTALTMIVRNEEHNLAACLTTVRDLVDDAVVVDTGSTDRTKEIAHRFGARVFDFPWVDSFSAARNEALRHAVGSWAFWMDADDRLDEENRRKLRALLGGLGNENAAYVMKCLCVAGPDGEGETDVGHVRLFRLRPDVRWDYRVHEQILPAVKGSGAEVRWSDVVIRHVGYTDTPLRNRKLDRDLRLLELEFAERPDSPFTLFNLGSNYRAHNRPAEALEALQKSLSLSHPQDSIVRKLYALIAQCYRQVDRAKDALASVLAGREHYPDDPELLLLEGQLRYEARDLHAAVAVLLRLIGGSEGAHFASVVPGLRGFRARHLLGVVYRDLGKAAEAESVLRLAVNEAPGFLPAGTALAELLASQGRREEADDVLRHIEKQPNGAAAAAVLRSRFNC